MNSNFVRPHGMINQTFGEKFCFLFHEEPKNLDYTQGFDLIST